MGWVSIIPPLAHIAVAQNEVTHTQSLRPGVAVVVAVDSAHSSRALGRGNGSARESGSSSRWRTEHHLGRRVSVLTCLPTRAHHPNSGDHRRLSAQLPPSTAFLESARSQARGPGVSPQLRPALAMRRREKESQPVSEFCHRDSNPGRSGESRVS